MSEPQIENQKLTNPHLVDLLGGRVSSGVCARGCTRLAFLRVLGVGSARSRFKVRASVQRTVISYGRHPSPPGLALTWMT
jgi:hypothetical protein